jgi:predicted permease
MAWRRLLYLLPWKRRAAERDMREELRVIAAMAEPHELGNLTAAAENARDAWGWIRWEQTKRDVGYALRSLRKTPGFTATAILSLALGIGANTALFTLINAVSWRLLPVRDPDALMVMNQRLDGVSTHGFSYQQYTLIRDSNDVLELAAYSPVTLNVGVDGNVEPSVDGLMVSGNFLPLLGIRPAAGRLLGPADDRAPAGPPVAMISHRYWTSRFDLDPDVVGRMLTISGQPFTIVGVTPAGFFGIEVGTSPQILVPLMMQPVVMPVTENLLDQPNQFLTWVRPVARVKPGVTPARAASSLAALTQSERTDWRPIGKFSGGRVKGSLELSAAATGLSDLRRQYSLPLQILMAVVGIVLLIACANTGNLMLARAASRRQEFALRLALGASRGRLVRQVLVEGCVLAAIAGLGGVALAYWATAALVAFVSAGQHAVTLDVSPDLRVLGFTAAVSMLTGLMFAVAPALRASRVDMTPNAKRDLAATRQRIGGLQPGRPLVIVQVALSLLLVIGAGLFLRSLENLNRRQLSLDHTQVLVVRVEPRGSDQRNIEGTTQRLDRIYRDLLARIEAIPGVASATLARTSPLTPLGYSSRIRRPAGDEVNVPALMTYPDYFRTMGLPLVQGRDFGDRDLLPQSPLVAVVNESFVREMLNGLPPLGLAHGITMPIARPGGETRPLEIIGVVKDSPYPNLRERPVPTMYQTFLQTRSGRGQMVLHVRVSGDVASVTAQVRDAVQRIDKDVPMFQLHTAADEIDAVLVRERLIALLSTFFGVVALLLVCVGLYGLMSFVVVRRTSEIGVRVALGASRGDVVRMIARQSITLIALGIALGLPIAWIAGRVLAGVMGSVLFELTPADPLTMAGATGVLLLVALAAAWLPAARAARIDPVIALRNE